MSHIKKYFSKEDLAKIEDAVRESEKQTGAEIVPYFVESSHDYISGSYRASTLWSICISGTFLLTYFLPRGWESEYFTMQTVLLVVFLGSILPVLVGLIFPKFRIWFYTKAEIGRITRRRAEKAFLQEEVFRTKDRTGVLLFMSFFERKIEILADKGISSAVDPSAWEEAVSMISKTMKTKDRTKGLCDAIFFLGKIYKEKGIVKKADDTNELKDNLRLG